MSETSDQSSSGRSSPYHSDEEVVIKSFISTAGKQDHTKTKDIEFIRKDPGSSTNKYKDYKILRSFKMSDTEGPAIFPNNMEGFSTAVRTIVIQNLIRSYKSPFIYVNRALLTDLDIPTEARKPSCVLCDTFVVSQGRPVGVFTFLSQDANADYGICLEYNSHIARGLAAVVRRAGLNTFIPVHGVFDHSTYNDLNRFQAELQQLEKRALTIGMRSSVQLSSHLCDVVIQCFVKVLFGPLYQTSVMKTACKDGNLQLVKDIISFSSDMLNISSQRGNTPLMWASAGRHYDVVKMLLSLNLDVNEKNKRGETALLLACGKKMLHRTLDRGEEENIRQLGCAFAYDLNISSDTSFENITTSREVVELLLSHGATENAADNDGFTPLIMSSLLGDLDVTDLLLSRGVNVNYAGILGSTALMWACMFNHGIIVDRLVQAGADVTQKANQSVTALSISSYFGSVEVAEKLISHGVDVNESDERKRTGLFYASWFGYPKLANLLLSLGARLDMTDFFDYTVVIAASATAHTKLAELMLSKGADIDSQDRDGRNALMWSSFSGHTETVHLLLSCGAKVNTRDIDGRTALMWASAGGWYEVVDLLLSNAADVNIKDNNGDTALSYVCRRIQNIYEWIFNDIPDNYVKVFGCFIANICKPKDLECAMNKLKHICSEEMKGFMFGFAELSGNVELLSALKLVFSDQYTDSPDELTANGDTGHDSVMKMLLRKAADVSVSNNRGVTFLMEASAKGYENGVKMLLQHKGDINICNMYGDTALVIASREGHCSIVELLLRNEADPNLCGSDGNTPLIEASREGYDTIVKILLRYGADMNIHNNDEQTALLLAEEGDHDSVVDILLKHQVITSNEEVLVTPHTPKHQTNPTYVERKDITGANTKHAETPDVYYCSNKQTSKRKSTRKKEPTKQKGKTKKIVKAKDVLMRNICKVS